MNDRDVQRQLETYFNATEARREPSDLLESVFAVTRRTGQRRGLSGRFAAVLDSPAVLPLRLSPAMAVVLLTVLLGVALVGAAVIGGQLMRGPSGAGWRELPAVADALPGSVYVSDLVAGGPGYVAIGSSVAEGTEACPAVRAHAWTSPDGAHWSEGPADALSDAAHLEMLVSTADGVYALGFSKGRAASCGFPDVGERAVWRSDDGATWSRLPALPANGTNFLGVPADDTLLLLVGREQVNPEENAKTEVWALTVDGWRLYSTIEDATIAEAVAAGPYVVLVGATVTGEYRPETWSSQDGGRTWQRGGTLAQGTSLHSLAAHDSRFVAAGWAEWDGANRLPRAVVAVSADGLSWTLTDPADEIAAEWIHSMVSSDWGLLAMTVLWEPSDTPTACPPPAMPSLEPEAPTTSGPIPSAASEPCTSMREVTDLWRSRDAEAWEPGPFVPSVGDDSSGPGRGGNAAIATSPHGVVVTNPGYGASVWFIPADALAR